MRSLIFRYRRGRDPVHASGTLATALFSQSPGSSATPLSDDAKRLADSSKRRVEPLGAFHVAQRIYAMESTASAYTRNLPPRGAADAAYFGCETVTSAGRSTRSAIT
jgi:hypothetical protein